MTDEALRALLHDLDFGEHGLTRNELRRRVPNFPEQVYLRLPDSKRYHTVEDILDETGWHALSRAEGEFVDPLDSVPAAGATDEGGPPAWGDSPLVESSPAIGAPDDQSLTGEPEHPTSSGKRSTNAGKRPTGTGT